ncbi:MAG: hypothetical protein KH345_11995 [Eubacterium sp.]|nr:hypothetical protein [Eubacterium sp.]
MTYLTTAQTAQLKGCSLQYVQKCVKDGKISAEVKANAANNRTEYIIPLTALPQDLQLKWENQQRRSLGLEPIKKAVKAPLKPAENRLTLDDLTDKQRSELYLWTGIIKDWLTIRDSYEQYSKGEIDEMYVQAARLKYPDLEISTDILYRRLKAYRNSDISGLIDKRGGSNKGTTTVPEFMLNAFSRFYLDQQCLPITSCYKFTRDWVQEHYPESLPDMPSERTFRRRAEDIPYAVRMYFRNGDKAFSDKCLPYVERLYDDLHANDVWIADNHTFDFFTAGKDGKVRRLYLTAFLDAKSGAMMGWNLTYAPSGDSTLLALEHLAVPRNRNAQRYRPERKGEAHRAHVLHFQESVFTLYSHVLRRHDSGTPGKPEIQAEARNYSRGRTDTDSAGFLHRRLFQRRSIWWQGTPLQGNEAVRGLEQQHTGHRIPHSGRS